MKREPFLAQLEPLGADDLRRVLWNLYWRAPAAFRERVEREIRIGRGAPRQKKAKAAPVDAWCVGEEVEEFCALARSGAYLGGTRDVTPKERSRWRFTLSRLLREAAQALAQGDFEGGAASLESLLDVTCEACDYAYFRSDDPVRAARVVVSDQAQLLWRSSLEHEGLKGFARRSASQLVRWENPYGWTRFGEGPIAAREVSLASVLGGMLCGADAWEEYADAYLDALDRVAAGPQGRAGHTLSEWEAEYEPKDRAGRLSEWHGRLLEALLPNERDGEGDRLGRLVRHRALAGPELRYLEARLARLLGEEERARSLMVESLRKLPGHRDFLGFAAELGMTEQDWRAAPASGG